MDSTDRKILRELQRDASRSVADIADAVGLSSTPCWRRIQNLEKAGVIRRRVALLDPGALNVGVVVFVQIRTGSHSREWLDEFARRISAIEEVMEFYRMSGSVDYMLKVVVPDIRAYDAVYKRLIEIPGLADVSSAFAMESIKYSTELPLDYV